MKIFLLVVLIITGIQCSASQNKTNGSITATDDKQDNPVDGAPGDPAVAGDNPVNPEDQTPVYNPITPGATTQLSGVWANDGEDKVTQSDLRSSKSLDVSNSVWDGKSLKLFGAKNEIVSFNLVLEAASSASKISVSFDTLKNKQGSEIKSNPPDAQNIFNYVGRNIELFYVRYLQIKGKSAFMCLNYDERHLPRRFQRPGIDENGDVAKGGWVDRPDHDTFYPDIAVPLELNPTFDIKAGNNQSIWTDIFIPKNVDAGIFHGEIQIKENNVVTWTIPVDLNVLNFALPDKPTAKTMINLGYGDINQRYLGLNFPNDNTPEYEKSKLIRDRHFQMAHRHKLSLIDANSGLKSGEDPDLPNSQWIDRLSGNLFAADKGYDGPGIGVGNDVFSVGTYGSWSFQNKTQSEFWNRSNDIVNWFTKNAPSVEYFLYLIDESSNYPQIEQWANWIQTNPGIGKSLKTMATLALPEASLFTPSLDIPTSGMYVGDTTKWENALKKYQNNTYKFFYMYNSGRPAAGSFMTEDNGIALRVNAWAQFKKGVHRWFYWESTYYNNFQAGLGETEVFKTAKTFGTTTGNDPVYGETGVNYSNGDGVLFYPGTDKVFPASSYGIDGPIASLRLKYWRRGIQDVDYLYLANQINPAKVAEIINRIIPKVLWEYGVDDVGDPTYKRTAISWSNDPDVWEAARYELAQIIINNI